MVFLKDSRAALNRAVKIINGGGVIVCPTDTVYGFLADATNKKAVKKLFRIKKRPRSKPLAVFVKDIKMAKELAEIDKNQEKILEKYWPGKYTFILKRRNSCEVGSHTISNLAVGGASRNKTIGIRIPKYKFLNDLLKKINKPLAQTSVNISGKPPMTKINEIIDLVKSDLTKSGTSKHLILVIDGGDLKNGNPSKIIDLTGEALTRLR